MKTLILLSLLAAISTQADMVKPYFRSNGTLVQGYDRTPANNTTTDNYSYRGPALGADLLRPIAPMPRPATIQPYVAPMPSASLTFPTVRR